MNCPNCQEMRESIAEMVATFVPMDPAQTAAMERAKSHLPTPEDRGERPLLDVNT